MASNMQSFPRILKMLRENSNVKEKRDALTYIRSNSKKLESTKAIKEEQYKELCKLIIDAFANGNNDIQGEAYETLNVMLRDFKDHSLNLFDAMSQISKKNRLKILKLLDVIEINTVSTVISDVNAVDFFHNCMCTIQTSTMPWTAPTACVENLQALVEAETRPLSSDQRLEEETIIYSINLLRRLYKVAAITSDIKIQEFDSLLLDKITVLAYMGHKRQRTPALNLLQQALTTNTVAHVRTKLTEAWARYKAALQSSYCKRMLLLVSACELDWATQWNISIQFLGVDLHRGAGLINNLLSVEEKAFKSTDTIIRRQAFLSWKLLVDNFALDPQELATARRIKLLCIPLNAKNSKNELIALTKLEVWWHVIIKLYKDISKFVNPVITQFLNFCFGPLGDTPLLSSKFDIVASPGKRFFKTKLVAVDALCQLLVTKQENHAVFFPILEERLPHSISHSVFRECYKSIIHSVGEALLVLSQLTDAEMKNRYQLGKILWTSLVNYVQESKVEKKELMYKDMILVITELTNYAMDKPMIRNLILNIILFEVADLSKNFNFQDDTLSGLVLKLLQTSVLTEAEKNHYEALQRLCWQCIKSPKENEYYSHGFKCLKQIYEKLNTLSNGEQNNEIVSFELWRILVEVLTKYMDDLQEINEGNATEHNLKTVEAIVIFPFLYTFPEDKKQVQEIIKIWKRLYQQFEMRANLMASVKPNEILLSIANALQRCLLRNEKSYRLIVHCLDTLLSTVNYKCLLAHVEVPSIIHLITKLITCSLSNKSSTECESTLKALSAVLITIYGHDPQKVISYLQVCKPAVELILTSELEPLCKEIANTWETIVSILKGLNKLLDYDLISSYKKSILQALNHVNPDIQSQTVPLFEIHNLLNSKAKLILEEIEKEASKLKTVNKPDIAQKNDLIEKLPNQGKIVGSFLNRGSSSRNSISKESERSDKQVSPDSDSQDYVLIRTDLRFDVNRLTEHQKESLKRRREDIPALYNDLSQSSSQDTQNLQEWFDRRNKCLEDAEAQSKKDNILIKNILNDDANKENKIEMQEPEISDKTITQNDTKSVENVGQSVSFDSAQTAKGNTGSNENSLIENVRLTTDRISESSESRTSIDAGANSLEEFSESKNNDQRLSPSILDNGKRRNRYSSVVKSSISPKSEEIVSSQPGHSNTTQGLHRTLRPKAIQNQPKIAIKQRAVDNTENKPGEEDKRGIKRKSVSDSESDGSNQRRRRKNNSLEIASDSDSCKSTESDNTALNIGLIEDGNLSQRTRNEISRLRINMVFDSPLSNSRRSKGHEDNKEAISRKQSPENKGAKQKAGDTKTGDTMKKTQKSNDTYRKGGRTLKAKLRMEKSNEFSKTEETRKTSQNRRNELEEKKKVEEDVSEQEQTEVASTSTSYINSDFFDTKKCNKMKPVVSEDDMSSNKPQSSDTDLNKKVTKTLDVISIDKKLPSQDDAEDIIENSQELSKLEKRCNEKQCFIKINKIGDVCNAIKYQEVAGDDEEVAKIVSNNCDNDNNEVPKDNIKEFKETNEVSVDKPKSTTPVIENNSFDNEKDVSEVQKGSEGLSIKSIVTFSSPKGNIKRQLKLKQYPPQGRAAHMLGLVTKQALMEAENHTILIDDEPVTKKTKAKDMDNETPLGKKERTPTLKEVDKVTAVTASCSSRQEKIFNNMKSTDYCSSPAIKLFSNLKNDGEKIFSKMDKTVDCIALQIETEVEKVNEETSLEMDDLPMLEWSSANPPSLTASPSVSILKRHRQTIQEPDPEATTPNKRKRVSFADPPVSKEMGYEISNNDSPHKANKCVPRGLLGRKDSPLRLKHVKQKLMHTDSDKTEKEETDMTDTSEVDLQCERENELLTKIAEELEYSEHTPMDTDAQPACSSVENDPINITSARINDCNKVKIDNLSVEFEITQNSTFSKRTELQSINTEEQNKKDDVLETSKSSIVSIENTEFDDSSTQEDIFNGRATKHDDDLEITETNKDINARDVQNLSVQNHSLGSPTNDSSRDHFFEKYINSENLEDTVDAENLTGINITANSDEIFCGRFIRTSTQAVENTEGEDTLPVTDSVFGSLPLSQESQNISQFNVEIPDPESLDSTQSIYPTLISRLEPIKLIIDQLTNPLWVQHLSTYFENRNLETVGDLARLSEREINRIPVKGNSKVEFVKNVLKWFEKTYVTKEPSSVLEASCSANVNIPASTVNVICQDQGSQTTFNTPQNESINHDTLFSQPSSSKMFDSVNTTDKNISDTAKDATRSTLNESSSVSVCSTFSQTSYEPTTTTTADMHVSASVLKPSDMTTIQMISLPVPSALVTTITPDTIIGNYNPSDAHTFSAVRAMKNVGTCTSTDSVGLSNAMAHKSTKSVAAQMALEDLLDEIDVSLVLASGVRRCSPEKILSHYKNKMRHLPPAELEKETIRMLGLESRNSCNETTLKTVCRACGINKVLLRLPDIFSADKEFFIKVLNAYRKKMKTSDCLNVLDFAEVKEAVCQKCTSSELAEMLSNKLKGEERMGIREPMTELSSLDAMLKRMPMDVIISHTVANDELIPSRVVLDIALQNNSASDIAQALESQSSPITKNVFDKLWSSQFAIEHIEECSKSKEDLLKILKAVSSKLSQQDLLQAFYESMNVKLTVKQEQD